MWFVFIVTGEGGKLFISCSRIAEVTSIQKGMYKGHGKRTSLGCSQFVKGLSIFHVKVKTFKGLFAEGEIWLLE